MSENVARRRFLKLGGAVLVSIPVLALTRPSFAATNTAMRTAMKYQITPNGERRCGVCAQFIPGKTATDVGSCKIFAGDTEVSPNGYCMGWMAKSKS